MLNGLEKALEKHIPEKDRRWSVSESNAHYDVGEAQEDLGWPAYYF